MPDTPKKAPSRQSKTRLCYLNKRSRRTADYLRWQDMDFVVEIEVKLSNNHNCKGFKFGRSATKETFKEYESGKPTELTKGQKEQITGIAREMGLKSHAPMTFFEADEGRANMNYGKGIEYSENCQCCVAIH